MITKRTLKLEKEEMWERWKRKKKWVALYGRERARLGECQMFETTYHIYRGNRRMWQWSWKKNRCCWGKGKESSTSELAFCDFSWTLATKPQGKLLMPNKMGWSSTMKWTFSQTKIGNRWNVKIKRTEQLPSPPVSELWNDKSGYQPVIFMNMRILDHDGNHNYKWDHGHVSTILQPVKL